MKKLLIIIALSTICTQLKAQELSFSVQNICPNWVQKVDTVHFSVAVIVDDNDYLIRKRDGVLIYRYELDRCNVIHVYQRVQKETFLLNTKPVEVLFYKIKGTSILYTPQ